MSRKRKSTEPIPFCKRVDEEEAVDQAPTIGFGTPVFHVMRPNDPSIARCVIEMKPLYDKLHSQARIIIFEVPGHVNLIHIHMYSCGIMAHFNVEVNALGDRAMEVKRAVAEVEKTIIHSALEQLQEQVSNGLYGHVIQ